MCGFFRHVEIDVIVIFFMSGVLLVEHRKLFNVPVRIMWKDFPNKKLWICCFNQHIL